MPKFRFKVFDPQTQSERAGALEAADSQSALQFLLRKGYTVEWVRPLKDSLNPPVLRVQEARKEAFEIIVEPVRYRPTLGDYWDRYRLSDQMFKLLLATGVVLGTLLLLFGDLVGPVASGSVATGKSSLQIALTGELRGSDGSVPSPESLKVTFRLPQIPLIQTWQGSEVLDQDGRLHGNLEFSSRRAAGYGEVLIEKAGYQSLRLDRKALSFNGTQASLDLGRQVMEPLNE